MPSGTALVAPTRSGASPRRAAAGRASSSSPEQLTEEGGNVGLVVSCPVTGSVRVGRILRLTAEGWMVRLLVHVGPVPGLRIRLEVGHECAAQIVVHAA